jgi:hypothetical protein
MIIIGITGGIGHGKSTLAAAFGRVEPNSRHLESFDVIAQVVDAWHAETGMLPNPHDLAQVNDWLELLPDILERIVHQRVDPARLRFGVSDITARPELYEKLFAHLQNLINDPELLKGRVTEANKPRYRAILQWLGGYLVAKIDSGIWYKELMRRAAEAGAAGVQLCTIGGLRYPADAAAVRGGGGYVLLINRPLVGDRDIADPTERERHEIRPDITVINNAGVPELVACAQAIYTDLKLGKLQNRYITSDLQQR